MNELSIKGIIFGVIADIAGNAVARVIMLIVYGGGVATEGLTDEQLNEAMLTVTQGSEFLMAMMIAGLICTVIGGYVAAQVAKKAVYLNAGAVGLVGISVLLGYVYAGETLSWYDSVDMILIIPAALLGGHLAKSTISGLGGQIT